MIYFDNAATTLQKPPAVAEAMLQALQSLGNAGRGAHEPTLKAARVIYDTRVKLACLFGAGDPARIAFASNATEALNCVLQRLFMPGDHVLTTVCEHNSVLRPLYLAEAHGVDVTHMQADALGRIDYAELEQNLRPQTKAVVITHASNLTGNLTDLKLVSAFAHKHGLLLVVDASQTAGSIPVDVVELGIDILCFTGHKGLMGPQGTGGIYVRPGLAARPFKVGGSGVHSFLTTHPSEMPTVLEAGTLNGHGIAGLNAALDFLLATGIEKIHAHEDKLMRRFVQGVQNLPAVKLYGDYQADERTAIVALNIGTLDSAAVSDILWEDYQICVRAGAHCAPLLHRHFGTEKQGAVRFSFGYFNTEAEVDIAIEAVKELACQYEQENG
jgi:cysteine desulfurase family protein